MKPDSDTLQPERSMRADARRNREKLLASAVELFGSDGKDVALESVAEHAGVGIGTLYRNFPTREALAEAAYRNELQRLCDAAPALLGELAPAEALAEWMGRFVTYVAAKRSMASVLQGVVASGSTLYSDARVEMLRAMTMLLGAAVEAGTVRGDVEPDDILRAMSAIWLAADGEDWERRARSLLSLLMDGLRYGAAAR